MKISIHENQTSIQPHTAMRKVDTDIHTGRYLDVQSDKISILPRGSVLD
jgi:hypothetical protein